MRAVESAAELTRAGEPVRYLGSLLMDEVVLCRFEGAERSVRRATEQAGARSRAPEASCSASSDTT